MAFSSQGLTLEFSKLNTDIGLFAVRLLATPLILILAASAQAQSLGDPVDDILDIFDALEDLTDLVTDTEEPLEPTEPGEETSNVAKPNEMREDEPSFCQLLEWTWHQVSDRSIRLLGITDCPRGMEIELRIKDADTEKYLAVATVRLPWSKGNGSFMSYIDSPTPPPRELTVEPVFRGVKSDSIDDRIMVERAESTCDVQEWNWFEVNGHAVVQGVTNCPTRQMIDFRIRDASTNRLLAIWWDEITVPNGTFRFNVYFTDPLPTELTLDYVARSRLYGDLASKVDRVFPSGAFGTYKKKELVVDRRPTCQILEASWSLGSQERMELEGFTNCKRGVEVRFRNADTNNFLGNDWLSIRENGSFSAELGVYPRPPPENLTLEYIIYRRRGR